MRNATLRRSLPAAVAKVAGPSARWQVAAFSTSRKLAEEAESAPAAAPSLVDRFSAALGIKPVLPQHSSDPAQSNLRRAQRGDKNASEGRIATPREGSGERGGSRRLAGPRDNEGKQQRARDGQQQQSEQPRYRREREGGGEWQPRRQGQSGDQPMRATAQLQAKAPGLPRSFSPATRDRRDRNQTGRSDNRRDRSGREEPTAELMPSQRIQSISTDWHSPLAALAFAPRGLVAPPRDEPDIAKVPFASLQSRPLRHAERALRLNVVQSRPTLNVASREAHMQAHAPRNKLQPPLGRLASDPGLTADQATELRHQALDEEAGAYDRFSSSAVAEIAGLPKTTTPNVVDVMSPPAVAAHAASLNADLTPESKAFVVQKVVAYTAPKTAVPSEGAKTIEAVPGKKAKK